MPYATRADLTTLGLPVGALAGVATAAQDAALASASAVADSFLRARFTLPLTHWAGDLTEKVCHVAAWTLLSSRGFNPDGAADMAVRQRYEDAIRWFEAIAAGRVTPSVTDSSVNGVPAAPRVAGGTLRGW